MNPFSLTDKIILITGASSGIGRECAMLCSGMGASLVITGRDKKRLNDTFVKMGSSVSHLAISADITDGHQTEALIRSSVERFGRLDGIIHCAGISTTLPLNMVKEKKMDEFFHTNVMGAINLTRLAVRHIPTNGGSIVFITSVMAVTGEAGKSLYSMTKGAMLAASRSLAIELAPRKIRVNCVSPGVVITPMSQKSVYSQSDEALEKIRALHPLGLGSPEDVAGAAVYLLSDAGRWVTGSNIIVDGGYTAR